MLFFIIKVLDPALFINNRISTKPPLSKFFARFGAFDWLLQIGPGIVHLTYESPIFGRGAFMQSLTPVEPLTQRMLHHVYANNFIPTFMAKFFLFSEALMVR